MELFAAHAAANNHFAREIVIRFEGGGCRRLSQADALVIVDADRADHADRQIAQQRVRHFDRPSVIDRARRVRHRGFVDAGRALQRHRRQRRRRPDQRRVDGGRGDGFQPRVGVASLRVAHRDLPREDARQFERRAEARRHAI